MVFPLLSSMRMAQAPYSFSVLRPSSDRRRPSEDGERESATVSAAVQMLPPLLWEAVTEDVYKRQVKEVVMKIAFVNGLLIDGNGGEPVKDSLVLVEGKKIVYAGKEKDFDRDYEIRDIAGKTIMPGLIDTHPVSYTHL